MPKNIDFTLIWGNRFDFFDYDLRTPANQTWKFVYPLPEDNVYSHDVTQSHFIAFPVMLRHMHSLPEHCLDDVDNITMKKISLYDAWRRQMEFVFASLL